jgi:nitrous oxidase accessory protein NosD
MGSWRTYAEVLVFAAVAFLTTAAHSATIAVSPGDSIAAAIAAASPGDTISFAPGRYGISAPISIAKSLTLRGPQADVDPRPSAGSGRVSGGPGEAVLEGAGAGMVLLIYADNVTIEGLEIANAGGLVYLSSSGAPRKNPTIRSCILHGAAGMAAVSLRQTEGACLQNNYVFSAPVGAFSLEYAVGCTVRENEISGCGVGIKVWHAYGTDIKATIEGNLIHGITGGAGISLGNESGVDESRAGGSIVDNVVDGVAGAGIAVFTGDTLIDGNEVTGCTGATGAVYVANRVAGAVITNNDIYDNPAVGVRVGRQHRVVRDVRVNDNTISGNAMGLLYVWADGAANLDATGNDWGDKSGPSGGGVDPSSGAIADGSGDSIMEAVSTGYGNESEPCPSIHVLFDPWGGASSTPPTASLGSPDPAVLWPANGKPVAVTIQGSVTDADGDLGQAWLEIEDEYGELDGTQDVTAALGPDGAFVTSVTLIARRDGKDKDGREYVITLYAVDAAGNEAASDSITVVVPHDQGKGR